MQSFSACAQVYTNQKSNIYTTEIEWRMTKWSPVGLYSLNHLTLKNSCALGILLFFLNQIKMWGGIGTKGRITELMAMIFKKRYCLPRSRSYFYEGLKELKKLELIDISRKRLPKNKGVLIKFLPKLFDIQKQHTPPPRSSPSIPKKTDYNKDETNFLEYYEEKFVNNQCPMSDNYAHAQCNKQTNTQLDMCVHSSHVHNPDTPLQSEKRRNKKEEPRAHNLENVIELKQKPYVPHKESPDTRGKDVKNNKNLKIKKYPVNSTKRKNKLFFDALTYAQNELDWSDKNIQHAWERGDLEIKDPLYLSPTGIDWDDLADRIFSREKSMTQAEKKYLYRAEILPYILKVEPKPNDDVDESQWIESTQVEREYDAAVNEISNRIENGEITEAEGAAFLDFLSK